jgi:hypothetical protein
VKNREFGSTVNPSYNSSQFMVKILLAKTNQTLHKTLNEPMLNINNNLKNKRFIFFYLK